MEAFKIFISHRHEDAATAAQLAELLRMFGGEQLDLSLSETVDPGEASLTRVEEKIREAEMLLLLLTAPSDLSSGWDWSLYEVGLFSSATDPQKRLVALSPPNLEVPAGFGDLQHIIAVPEQIVSFLIDLFGRTTLTGRNEPINRNIEEASAIIEELAGEICAFLAPLPVGARMHANYLILKFPKGIQQSEIPADVEVEGNSMSLKMFGLLERDQCTWGDIRASLSRETTWVSELGNAIHAINSGRYPTPIKSTLQSTEGQSYLPIVYRDETRSSGLRLFHVLFVPTDLVPIDPELVFVITAFRDDMEPIYEAIEAAVSSYALSAKRVKDIVGDYRITDKILSLISKAKYVSQCHS